METGFRFINDIMVISFYGELHSAQTETLLQKFKAYINKADKFILNLTDLEYIDSKGLGCLIRFQSNLKNANKLMVICGVSGKVKKVFSLTRFDQYMNIFDTAENAAEYLSKQ